MSSLIDKCSSNAWLVLFTKMLIRTAISPICSEFRCFFYAIPFSVVCMNWQTSHEFRWQVPQSCWPTFCIPEDGGDFDRNYDFDTSGVFKSSHLLACVSHHLIIYPVCTTSMPKEPGLKVKGFLVDQDHRTHVGMSLAVLTAGVTICVNIYIPSTAISFQLDTAMTWRLKKLWNWLDRPSIMWHSEMELVEELLAVMFLHSPSSLPCWIMQTPKVYYDFICQ